MPWSQTEVHNSPNSSPSGTTLYTSNTGKPLWLPERNGQAEAANKLVLNAIQKDLEGARGQWSQLLPKALWAVRTTIRGPTGETPFALTYGSEALAPVEMGLPTL